MQPFKTALIASANISIGKPVNGHVLVLRERNCNTAIIRKEQEKANVVDNPTNCQSPPPPQLLKPPTLYTHRQTHTHPLSASPFSLSIIREGSKWMLHIFISLITTDNEISVNNPHFSNERTQAYRDPGTCT